MVECLMLKVIKMRLWLEERRGELDEKALLIAFFVLVAVVGVYALGSRVSQTFQSLASRL